MKLLNTEQKTFEYGILRLLGSTKKGIICLILTESLFFIVPAIIIGFIFSVIALFFISKSFKENLNLEFPIYPPLESAIEALIIGSLIPLVSSLIPIRVALAKRLNLALDAFRSEMIVV